MKKDSITIFKDVENSNYQARIYNAAIDIKPRGDEDALLTFVRATNNLEPKAIHKVIKNRAVLTALILPIESIIALFFILGEYLHGKGILKNEFKYNKKN